jgi:hypothetical protein
MFSAGTHRFRSGATVDIDLEKVDEAVLALLYLGLHDGARAWKGFDWGAMNRLHTKGYITDPVSKAKSVLFTEEGLAASELTFRKLFVRGDSSQPRGPQGKGRRRSRPTM